MALTRYERMKRWRKAHPEKARELRTAGKERLARRRLLERWAERIHGLPMPDRDQLGWLLTGLESPEPPKARMKTPAQAAEERFKRTRGLH